MNEKDMESPKAPYLGFGVDVAIMPEQYKYVKNKHTSILIPAINSRKDGQIIWI